VSDVSVRRFSGTDYLTTLMGEDAFLPGAPWAMRLVPADIAQVSRTGIRLGRAGSVPIMLQSDPGQAGLGKPGLQPILFM
jgi:hypothetical protein